MLGWSMVDLARASGLSISTVQRSEDGRAAAVSHAVHSSIREAFKTAGVRFVNEKDEFGLLLRAPSRAPCEKPQAAAVIGFTMVGSSSP
jgi:hypothetical protein